MRVWSGKWNTPPTSSSTASTPPSIGRGGAVTMRKRYPSPSYPIHIWGPILAGADVRHVRLGPEQDFFANLVVAWEDCWPRPRVIVLSFPHNPTTACVDLDFMTRMVAFARERDVLLVHD